MNKENRILNNVSIDYPFINDEDYYASKKYPKGELIKDISISSKFMGQDMNFNVYIPYGFKDEKINNFIYVIDGSQYLEYGNMNTTVDFLMYEGYIPKSIIVLIDPCERTNEHKISYNYIKYIKNELIPYVESTYTICRDYIKRTMIGASWGAMTTMYIAMTSDNLIDNVITQSGSFWAKDWMIFDIINEMDKKDINFCIQTGVKNDTEFMNERMSKILKDKGYNVVYQKFNEGHNWSNWKNHLSEALIAVFDNENNEAYEDEEDNMDYIMEILSFD
ncbi:MAG TPA: alpha/beta hydrolase-fold protein [Pseudobacteroides sp.]|uniref:alpha/beta hydrolase n=1 Tax=Pseudobacteroides sp. TaxID=1968840 RepID=UPI002F944662